MDKKSEKTNFFEILYSSNNNYLASKEELKDIYDELNENIGDSTEKIKIEYQEQINKAKDQIISTNQEFEKNKKLLESYSTFDSEIIGNIIAQLISTIEGKNFSYQTANYITYEHEFSVLFEINIKLCMVVNENIKLENWDDLSKKGNTVEKLVNNGDALVLSIKNYRYDYDKKINFYTFNDGSLISLINFDKFSYIKEFIDTVIQYRFDKKIENISEKELLKMMKQFILSKNELINEKKLLQGSQQQLLLNNKS